MRSPPPRIIADIRPPMPSLTSASSDEELKAALQAYPTLTAARMSEAYAAYLAARQAHGQFWRGLDAEISALNRTLQKHQSDPMTGGSGTRNSAAWWVGRVSELRACLAAAERFRSTGPRQIGVSEAQSRHQATPAACEATPA